MSKVFHADAECSACKGTGLYVGYAEGNGAAVVCQRCKGTGCDHVVVHYIPFSKRKRRDGVRRVYQANPGIGLNCHPDLGGMSYDDWMAGRDFPPRSEARGLVCPCQWYQTADSSKKPEWKECTYGVFTSCKYYAQRNQCWARWDQEFGTASQVQPIQNGRRLD